MAELVGLAFPLEPGRCYVVNRGSNISTNAHLVTLDASVPRYGAWRGQSYGIDLVELDGFGLRALSVQTADPRAYRIYSARVLAACTGQVVIAEDGLPDMRVPTSLWVSGSVLSATQATQATPATH